ncbi:hypothetical protein BHM03_00062912 [Ensete ventricosum]|nr:hypothetical protein BHM03_00062912 [Ensete ventricosum]
MSLLSSAPEARAVVAAAVLFLCQPHCCLPPLCHQSCEQDQPGRASPAASPPQSQRALLPLCSSSASPLTRSLTGAGAAASTSSVSSSLCCSRESAATVATNGSNRNSNCFPYSLFVVVHSFRSNCLALDPSLHHCHRHAPPLYLIVIGSDLWPTVPSHPSNALLLLPQPLLAGCLTPALLPPLSLHPLQFSTVIVNRPFPLLLPPLSLLLPSSLLQFSTAIIIIIKETKVRKRRRQRASMSYLSLLTFSRPARSFYQLSLLDSTDAFFLGS